MRICKKCLQDTTTEDSAYLYANKNYCVCRECTKKKWAEANYKASQQRGSTMLSTDKWTLGETYRFKPNTSKRDKMAVFMGMVLDCEDHAVKMRVE